MRPSDLHFNKFGSQIDQIGTQCVMAENQKASVRLRPITHRYLMELVRTGAYGKGKAGVMRTFIENGIIAALQGGVISKKSITDLGETVDENDMGDD